MPLERQGAAPTACMPTCSVLAFVVLAMVNVTREIGWLFLM